MKAGLLGLGLVIISSAIAIVIIFTNSKNTPESSTIHATLPAQVKLYTHPIYNFSFSYPSSDQIIENQNSIIIKSNGVNNDIVGQIIVSGSAINRNRMILQLLTDLCKEHKNTTRCSVDSQSVVGSLNGAIGNSYYLQQTLGVIKNLVGPFVVFALPSASLFQPQSIIFYPSDLTLSREDKEHFMGILQTLKFSSEASTTSPSGSSSAK